MSTPFRSSSFMPALASSPANAFASATVLAAAALIAGCSGEARPFEEAVEVSELDLAALEIVRPEGTLDPLFVNAGQRLEFGLSGTNSTGGAVEISGNDRDWRVSDGSVASISDDGVFVARADGPVEVGVRIGDIAAQTFDVDVSTSSIESIALIDGPENLDPCVGAQYRAEAEFADGSRRSVSAADIVWSSDATSALLDENENGIVTFSAPNPGAVQLTATVGEASLARSLVVGDTLPEGRLEIGPATLATRVGGSQQLTATGSFDDGNGGTREEIITEGVVWSISSGAEFASIGNEAGSRGLVSADDDGIATVVASCGNVSDSDTFEAQSRSSSGDDDDDLAFDGASDDDVLEVRLSDSPVTVLVSTGDEYDSDDDVSDDADFILIDSNQDFVNVLEDPLGRTQLQLLREGTVRFDVIADGREARLTVRIEN